MKQYFHTLQDTLVFQLQGLYYAGEKLKDEFKGCSGETTSIKIKAAIETYIDYSDTSHVKLERIFNYLMHEPETRKNISLVNFLTETRELLSYTDSPHLRDILMISCLQNINSYMVTSLKTAYMFTVELELDNVSDLLQQMLEWELEMGKSPAKLAIEEFNKGHALV
jgi:ferritin-like metal-binding protein YciE